jgi:hypothetical protein
MSRAVVRAPGAVLESEGRRAPPKQGFAALRVVESRSGRRLTG